MQRILVLLMIGAGITTPAGCHITHRGAGKVITTPIPDPRVDETPRELDMAVLPPYRIAPPDVLVIEALRILPKIAQYNLQPLDIININVQNTLPGAPISDDYPIEPGGSVNFGDPYGKVQISGLTVKEAEGAVSNYLRSRLAAPFVAISLIQTAGKQAIAGEHLVGPDGTVRLGSYGSVSVVGMTMDEAEAEIEQFLSNELENPEIALDVVAYNSKVYYVITEGGGFGDTVTKFPITGNETLLDAISNITGLTEVSSKRIWITRPTRDPCKVQILPVDWKAITAMGDPGTNYQLLPGDRVFVAENELVALDSHLGKFLAPFERIMGFSILGASTVTRFTGRVLSGGGDQRGGFGGGGF